MIIAIPVITESLKSQLSDQFARAPHFAIINKAEKQIQIISNPFAQNEKGVGKNVFQLLVEQNKVNAFAAFELGLKVQLLAEDKTIQQIIINDKSKLLHHWLKLMNIPLK